MEGGSHIMWARHRFRWSWLIIVLLLIPASVQASRVRVGVFEFGGVGGYDEKQTASSLLAKALVDLGRFDVIERQRLDHIMREQRFQQSYPVDQFTAVEMGKVAGIAAAFIGQIDSLDAKWNRVSDGPGFYLATANLSIKIIDVRSGQLMKVLTVMGTGTGDRRDEAHVSALQACFRTNLVDQLKRVFSLESRVSRVEGDDVYLPLGRDSGIKPLQRFVLLRAEGGSDWSVDFDEGFMEEVGLVQIKSVSGSTARGRVIWSHRPPRVGDILVEESRSRNFTVGVSLQGTGLRLTGSSVPAVEETVATLVWRLGQELPFHHETGVEVLVASSLAGVGWGGFGLYGSLERPLVRGFLNATMQGAVGAAIATQYYSGYPGAPWTIPSAGTATGAHLYLRGDAGLKLYMGRKRGLRMELGTSLLATPPIRRWTAKGDSDTRYDVTKYVNYAELHAGSLSVRAGVAAAF